ncbi:MAG: DUF2894 domain-containing protein [Roseateles sp.]|uniref:DUF2894 domain-containing protein n=1 Tax=Roseateles sp. TaxID=1971397 RepID=UPI0039E77574
MDARDDPLAWARAQDADPVRRRVLEALARRAAALPPGALRERLVQALLRRAQAAPSPAPLPAPPAARPGPQAARAGLAALLAALQAGAGPELRTVRAHQRTWSALRLTRRMAEVAAPIPEHLGPLHSQVLVTRALQRLEGLSPAYLQRLLAQLDGLAALAPLQAAAEAEKPARAARPAAAKKPPARRR